MAVLIVVYRAAGALGVEWLGSLANGRALRPLDHAFLHRECAFHSDARRTRSHDAAFFS